MQWLKMCWTKYINWCDSMGLVPENQRCCAPRLSDVADPKSKASVEVIGKAHGMNTNTGLDKE